MPRKDQDTANKTTQDKSKVVKEDKPYSFTMLTSQSARMIEVSSYEQLNEDLCQESVPLCSPGCHFFLLKCNTEHA